MEQEIKTSSSYSPEDNKLRLYVGRVPRDEYEALRADGWTSTPKQSCDFVAVWTESRERTALKYGGGYIGDEDTGPAERAADRAERFAQYRENRIEDAQRFADRYDGQPLAHGYQDEQRAQRSAARHDRLGTHAVNNWEKAEYWTERTAGVISHALYTSQPSVRMGRIKEIETDIRRIEKSWTEYNEKKQLVYDLWAGIAGKREKFLLPAGWQYIVQYHEIKPETEGGKLSLDQWRLVAAIGAAERSRPTYADSQLEKDLLAGTVTPLQAAAAYFETQPERPADEKPNGRAFQHLQQRLAYENQMLQDQGGRAGEIEMEVGGFVGGRQIWKINKSATTGRVVSVTVKAPLSSLYCFDPVANKNYGPDHPRPIVDTLIRVEKLSKEIYRAPTEQEKADFKAAQAEHKESNKKESIPLINPTHADAQRLQAIWNEEYAKGRKHWTTPPTPSTPKEMTQEEYNRQQKAVYSPNGKTVFIRADGQENYVQYRGNVEEGAVCKVRRWYQDNQAYQVIILTDKPQKPLPAFAPITKPETVHA